MLFLKEKGIFLENHDATSHRERGSKIGQKSVTYYFIDINK